MKKSLLFLMCVFLLLFSISAQDNKETSANNVNNVNNVIERKYFFVGIGIKGDIFLNDNTVNDSKVWKNPTLGGKVFAGKWFNRYLGSRIEVDFGQIKPTFQYGDIIVKENYILGRLDMLFDFTNCFRSYSPDRIYNMIPYIGIGGAQSFNAYKRPDNRSHSSSFLFGGGLMNTFRVSEKFSVFFNLGIDFVDSDFDGSQYHKLDAIADVAIGIIMNF